MNNEGLNVLSLFDGMSCGMIALERAGIRVKNYYASEVDKHAIKVSRANYPNIIQLEDVRSIDAEALPKIDLLIGGSPCQSISTLGDGTGLEGTSGLFYQYLRLKKELNPKYFILENVVGNKEAIKTISDLMGVDPVLFNSNLVSAQNRSRYYWTNIPFVLPEDKGIKLLDVLDDLPDETSVLSEARLRWLLSDKGQDCLKKRYASLDPEKASCLTARSDASWNCNYVTRNGKITKLTCSEYEKLQTVPVGYTSCVAPSQRYKMLGNGWTIDVIANIFQGLQQSTFEDEVMYLIDYDAEVI